jgi:outer membrane biosynthesis protein TonB
MDILELPEIPKERKRLQAYLNEARTAARRRLLFTVFLWINGLLAAVVLSLFIISSTRDTSPTVATPVAAPAVEQVQPTAPAVEQPAPGTQPDQPAQQPAPAVEQPAPGAQPDQPAQQPAPAVEQPAPAVEQPAPGYDGRRVYIPLAK